MKIHEYQGKILLKEYNLPIQDGYVVEDPSQIESTIERVRKDFNSDAVVVKAQIHAGGRGKGGGVKYSPTPESALENANKILGMDSLVGKSPHWRALIVFDALVYNGFSKCLIFGIFEKNH